MARTIERGDLLKLSAGELEIAISTEKFKRNLKRKRQQSTHETHIAKKVEKQRILDPYADAQYAAYQRYGYVEDCDAEFSA